MAEDIRTRLLEQAKQFHLWQETTYPGITAGELGGEWEVDYPYWDDAYHAFCLVFDPDGRRNGGMVSCWMK